MKISFDTKEESTAELREIITCLQRIIEHRGSPESDSSKQRQEDVADTQPAQQDQGGQDALQSLMGMMNGEEGKEETKQKQDTSPEIMTY